jgi:hypothetical protein
VADDFVCLRCVPKFTHDNICSHVTGNIFRNQMIGSYLRLMQSEKIQKQSISEFPQPRLLFVSVILSCVLGLPVIGNNDALKFSNSHLYTVLIQGLRITFIEQMPIFNVCQRSVFYSGIKKMTTYSFSVSEFLMPHTVYEI